jgi:hypothetical protein
LGDSVVCPKDGLVPTEPPTNFEFTPSIPGAIKMGSTPSEYNYSSLNFYICIPSPNGIINTSNSIFSDIGPINYLNYAPDQIEIDSSNNTYRGISNSMSGIGAQVGRVYDINIGIAHYTFIEYMSFFSSGYYNNGNYVNEWPQYISAASVLWEGAPELNACIMVDTSVVNIVPPLLLPCWNAINDLGLTNINLG